jgi:hypothetical protein
MTTDKLRWYLLQVDGIGHGPDLRIFQTLRCRVGAAHMYFAVYGPPDRLVVKFAASMDLATIKQVVTRMRAFRARAWTLEQIKSGSLAHARAFEAVLEIRRRMSFVTDPEAEFFDVVHWMSNMLGLNYAEELIYLCHHELANLRGILERSQPGRKHPLEVEKSK